MTWAMVILFAVAAFGLILALRAPRVGWEAVGAALLVGIAGYALQASPGLPGAPKEAAQQAGKSGAALVEARQQLAEAQTSGEGLNRWLVIGDALARNGQFGDAADHDRHDDVEHAHHAPAAGRGQSGGQDDEVDAAAHAGVLL